MEDADHLRELIEEEWQELVRLFGGIPVLADELRVRETAVYNWRHRGISNHTRWRLYLLARRKRLRLPAWFFVDMEDEPEAA